MYYVGIDIAKSFHVVSVIDDNETKVINKPFKINNKYQDRYNFNIGPLIACIQL